MPISYLPSLDLRTDSGSQWPSNTRKPLLEASAADPVSSAKPVLAQFTVTAQSGSCKTCCCNTLKYKWFSWCQGQHNRQSWTTLQCATTTKLLRLQEMISPPQHLHPRAPRAREKERSPPKVCAKGREGEEMRQKEENYLLVTESAVT